MPPNHAQQRARITIPEDSGFCQAFQPNFLIFLKNWGEARPLPSSEGLGLVHAALQNRQLSEEDANAEKCELS